MIKLNKVWMFVFIIILLSFNVFAVCYNPTSYNIVVGEYVSGDINSIDDIDSNYLIIKEVNEGYDIRFNFSDVTNFTSLIQLYKYSGGGVDHIVDVQLYNYVMEDWQLISQYDKSDFIESDNIPITQSTRFISDGIVQLRHLHSTPASTNHILDIEYIGLDCDIIDDIIDTEDSFNTGYMFFILSMIIIIIITGFILKTMIISLLGTIGFLLFSLQVLNYNLGVGIISVAVSMILLITVVLWKE